MQRLIGFSGFRSANVFGRKRWVLYRNNPGASFAETRDVLPEEKLEIVQEAATVVSEDNEEEQVRFAIIVAHRFLFPAGGIMRC